jgi:GT2 family glycosyltransferase
MKSVSITFACLNQADYTAKLLTSLEKANISPSLITAVDNASTDHTREILRSAGVGTICNKSNLGCGVAWNQGILDRQSEWTVVMNNDVVVHQNWLNNLITGAESSNLLIASPAMIEGPLTYDFDQIAALNSEKLKHYVRRQSVHAVCMAIHHSVFQKIGFFQPKPSLLGFEDTLFFHEASKAEIPVGIVGDSWIHHFGSITQKWLKEELGIPQQQGLGDRNNKRLLSESWLERKLRQIRKKRLNRRAYNSEMESFGVTVHGLSQEDGTVEWI